jgi:hypothetical protein
MKRKPTDAERVRERTPAVATACGDDACGRCGAGRGKANRRQGFHGKTGGQIEKGFMTKLRYDDAVKFGVAACDACRWHG